MPKTEVILTHNVVGLGAESDHVKVAAGYARNYLFPQGLAIPLTSANKRQIEALQKRRVDRESKELHAMTDLASTLNKLTLVLHVKTGEDGKLFGSVTAGTIADELRHQYDAQLDKRKIHLAHPIKTLGEHEVPLHLHQDVDCILKVKVESTTPLSPEVQAALTAQNIQANKEAREARESAKASGKEARPAKGGKGERAEKSEGKPAKGEAKASKGEGKKAEKSEKGEKKAKTSKE